MNKTGGGGGGWKIQGKERKEKKERWKDLKSIFKVLDAVEPLIRSKGYLMEPRESTYDTKQSRVLSAD